MIARASQRGGGRRAYNPPMRRRRRSASLATLLAACAAAAWLGLARHAPRSTPAPSPGRPAAVATAGYDQFVLALSWSPAYCIDHPADREQCGRRGLGLVVHGLWPQYADGNGPEGCATALAPDAATIDRALAFMPSRSLIRHQWRKHGSCSGLSPRDYFALTEQAWGGFRAPPALQAAGEDRRMRPQALRTALREANSALADDMLSLHCEGGRFTELRLCLDRDTLAPERCRRRARGCSDDRPFTIPANEAARPQGLRR